MGRIVRSRTWKIGATALLAMVVLAACVPGKVTGGGWIYSAVEDGGKATFSFSANLTCNGGNKVECDLEDLSFRGNGTYHDKAAGVKFSFDGAFGFADGDGRAGIYVGLIGYTSQDKKNPGSGDGCVVLFDGGEGSKIDEGDFIYITLGLDGSPDDEFEALCYEFLDETAIAGPADGGDPYDDYENGGDVNGGNVQVHIKKKDVEE